MLEQEYVIDRVYFSESVGTSLMMVPTTAAVEVMVTFAAMEVVSIMTIGMGCRNTSPETDCHDWIQHGYWRGSVINGLRQIPRRRLRVGTVRNRILTRVNRAVVRSI